MNRRIVKATVKRKTISKKKTNEDHEASQKNVNEAITAFSSLLNVFSCSRDHGIVGRNQEERAIRNFIEKNIEYDQSGLLYVCGHPGQGKTAVIN